MNGVEAYNGMCVSVSIFIQWFSLCSRCGCAPSAFWWIYVSLGYDALNEEYNGRRGRENCWCSTCFYRTSNYRLFILFSINFTAFLLYGYMKHMCAFVHLSIYYPEWRLTKSNIILWIIQVVCGDYFINKDYRSELSIFL